MLIAAASGATGPGSVNRVNLRTGCATLVGEMLALIDACGGNASNDLRTWDLDDRAPPCPSASAAALARAERGAEAGASTDTLKAATPAASLRRPRAGTEEEDAAAEEEAESDGD